VALGIGLLIGAERERHKGEGRTRRSAGIRTFAAAALLGAVSRLVGGGEALAASGLAIAALAGLAYWRSRENDPGLTSEVTLVLTVFLGGFAMQAPALSAGVAVVVAVLLAARTPLHRFVRSVLTDLELNDALIFAIATLVVLPLLPNRPMGPFDALNPHSLWIIVVLVLAISAAGHILVRMLGARYGLPLAGLASGFVSSVATIGAMGARAAKSPPMLGPATAGAVLSTLATSIQLSVVVAAQSTATLRALAAPVVAFAIASGAYGLIFTFGALRQEADSVAESGSAFSVPGALIFAGSLAVISLVSAALQAWLGEAGAMIGAGLGGFVDAHAAAISVAALVSSGKLTAAEAVMPILLGLSTNTISKVIAAGMSGGRAFTLRVFPGLALSLLAAWLATVGQLLLHFG
jgi:uncharacterized membrane protein (DUF4010 family)